MRIVEVVIDVRSPPVYHAPRLTRHRASSPTPSEPSFQAGLFTLTHQASLTALQGRELQLHYRTQWQRQVQHP